MDELMERISQLESRLAAAAYDRNELVSLLGVMCGWFETLAEKAQWTPRNAPAAWSGYRASKAAMISTGCTRSHPHEDMSPECEAKTVEAREANARRHQELQREMRTIADLGEWKIAEAAASRMRATFKVPCTPNEEGLRAFANTVIRCNNLAQKIADESSASLLECNLNHRQGWLDIHTAEAHEDHAINEAVEYLKLRGLLERHPSNEGLVRVIEQEGGQCA